MPAGLALKRALGSIDVRLIDPGEISICKRADGSDWLLGAGSFGKVMLGSLAPGGRLFYMTRPLLRTRSQSTYRRASPSLWSEAVQSEGFSHAARCSFQAYKGLWSGKEVAVKQLVSCSQDIAHHVVQRLSWDSLVVLQPHIPLMQAVTLLVSPDW